MRIQKICILGGTGFIGGHLVAHLVNEGRTVKILTRNRERHKELMVMPGVELVEADIRDPQALQQQFSGHDAVINLIGILNGSEEAFRAVHVELPRRVAQACQQAGVKRLLHMSALNADAAHGTSLYLRSKGEGEDAVHQVAANDLTVTSFRPSTVFGPDDSFINRFAGLLKLSPVLPLACPHARLSPVYVGDVVLAFDKALENQTTSGQRLELCGPRIYTLKEIVEYTARLIDRRRLIIGLPDGLSRLQGQVMQHLPGQPFTLDNYLSLQVDNVCRSNALPRLGITPKSMEAMMPVYFKGKHQHALYNRFRRMARRD
jgi:NADH dehydrogenase